MQIFIQVSLRNSGFYDFQQPVIQWLKDKEPAVTALDIDAQSDEMLVNQACRLIREAEKYAVYFRVIEPNAGFGPAFRLLEEIIRENKPALILLEGTHARLASIVQARPFLTLAPADSLAVIQKQLADYFLPA